MGVLTLEDETGGHLPAASATVDPELGDHLPIPNLVVPSRSPLTVEISLTADNNHRSLEHTSISSNTSPELEGSVSCGFFQQSLPRQLCSSFQNSRIQVTFSFNLGVSTVKSSQSKFFGDSVLLQLSVLN